MVDAAKRAGKSDAGQTDESETATAKARTPEKKTTPESATVVSGNRKPAAFEDFRINFIKPLSDFSRPQLEAYEARRPKEGDRVYILYTYTHVGWCRHSQLARIAELKTAGIMRPVWWGAVDVPNKGRQFGVIVEKPLGKRVVRDITQPPRLSEAHITEKLIRPALITLRQYFALSQSHRALHPLNLYYADEDETRIVLGPSFLLPPGLDNPIAYETIETMMAEPAGRGDGNVSDDLYALGLTIFALATGQLWLQVQDSNDLIEQKIMQGSYTALVGQYRLPLPLQEAIKGLLNDDPDSRWTLDELENWLDGVSMIQRQHKPVKKATRTFDIGDETYLNSRSLAYNLHRHWQKALEIMAGGQLDNWLRRSLGQEIVANNVDRAIRTNVRASSNQVHYRTCFAIAALDPPGPLYYRGFRGHIDGIGYYLAYHFHDQTKRQTIAELIRGKAPSFWLKCQPKIRPEWVSLSKIYENMALMVDRQGPGYGIERCLYELNPDMPCQSSFIESEFISNPADILPAMEKIAGGIDHNKNPMDRHLAAFLATHISAITETMLYALGDTKSSSTPHIAALNIYTMLQQRFNIPAVPNMTQWFANILKPAVQTFYNKERQQRIADTMSKAAQSSTLNNILKVIDNTEEKKRDINEFVRANSDYLLLTKELEKLAERKRRLPDAVRETTIKLAPIVSGLLATIGLFIYVLT